MTNTSLKDIARHYNVSDKTVQRIVDAEALSHHNYQTQCLPQHMAFDEFKSTNHMSFIWCDRDSRELGEILPFRTARTLKAYFESFPLEVRTAVESISVDLNAGYVNLIPRLFPNAEIVIDRFHIVQMVNRAGNQIRIQVMEDFGLYVAPTWLALKRSDEVNAGLRALNLDNDYDTHVFGRTGNAVAR